MIKKIPHIIYLFFLLISCNNNSKTPEEQKDFQEWNESKEHEAVGEEETFNTEYDDEEWEYEEDFEEETSYIITEKKEYFKSKFKRNQIQNNVYFVYEEDGTNFFRNQNLDSVNFHLTYGNKITVIEKLDKNHIDIIKNLNGKLWKVKHEKDYIGYINSSVLSPFPFYPNYEKKGLYQITQILHLVDSVLIEEQKTSYNSDPFWQRKTYLFENKIKLETYYDLTSDSEGTTLIIPDNIIDVSQAFVFLDFISEVSIIGSIFKNNFPNKNLKKKTEAYDEKYHYIDVDIEVNFKNEVLDNVNLVIHTKKDCVYTYLVYKSKKSIIISINKGC